MKTIRHLAGNTAVEAAAVDLATFFMSSQMHKQLFFGISVGRKREIDHESSRNFSPARPLTTRKKSNKLSSFINNIIYFSVFIFFFCCQTSGELSISQVCGKFTNHVIASKLHHFAFALRKKSIFIAENLGKSEISSYEKYDSFTSG
jgi:hypothetical protein